MTIFFRRLADVDLEAPSLDTVAPAFYSEEKRRAHEPAFRAWLERYTNRVRLDGPDPDRPHRMRAANPRYVLRNFLAQQAIDRAEQGDLSAVSELLDLSDHIRELIIERRPASEIKRAAMEEGMVFLRESALQKAMQGVTTLREINKVTFVD